MGHIKNPQSGLEFPLWIKSGQGEVFRYDFGLLSQPTPQMIRPSRFMTCEGPHFVPSRSSGQIQWRRATMVREEDVLAALDKPRAVYAILQLVDPSSKSTDALQDLLMRMRTDGKVKFDINKGKWSKA
jgi:hypothetical protein